MRFLKAPAVWVFLLQFVLVLFIFHKVLFLPSNYYTCNRYDGIKILFTLQSYVEQQGADSWNTYKYMNYPYGEHIIFAGGNPVFSILLKSLFEANMISAQWVIPIYFWLILLSIPLTALFFNIVLIEIVKNKWVSFFLSLTLPWINYQLMRLQVGHFDLSMTCFLLFNLYILIQVSKKWHSWRSQWVFWVIYFIMIIFLAYLHLYLAAIIAFFTSTFCVVMGLLNFKDRRMNILSSITGACVSGLAFGIILFLFALTDPIANERKAIPEGYNWHEWNAQFSSIFTPSHGEKVKFPLQSNTPIKYENDTYISSFALFGLMALVIGYFFRKRLGLNYQPSYVFSNALESKVLLSFLIASLVLLFVSFGEQFFLLNGEYVLKNYFNLFLIVKKVYPKIQQFRVLARFNFYFFWVVNILVAYMLVAICGKYNWGRLTIGLLLVLSFIDLRDRLSYIKDGIEHDNIVNEINGAVPDIDYSKFQSILPIPFYLAGSEDYNITIDPEDNWCTFTFYLSYHSKLPLMSSKMSRSSLVQSHALISLFLDRPDADLIQRLEKVGKPVLVVYNTKVPKMEIHATDRPIATEVNNNFEKFLDRESLRLKKITEYNGMIYYSWNPVVN